jgi:predicted thioesterase
MSEPSSSRPSRRERAQEALTVVVSEDMTAAHVGSGTVSVLATPQVVALVERAAVALVDPSLPDGTTSVGVAVAIDHLAPTPPGVEVTTTVRVEQRDARKVRLSFVTADPGGEVARGSHVRVLVDRASFERQALARAAGAHPRSTERAR